jgi:hypothetical protein
MDFLPFVSLLLPLVQRWFQLDIHELIAGLFFSYEGSIEGGVEAVDADTRYELTQSTFLQLFGLIVCNLLPQLVVVLLVKQHLQTLQNSIVSLDKALLFYVQLINMLA